MANHEQQRFLWSVSADGRDLVLCVIELLQIIVIRTIAHVVHNLILFFNPSVIHSFVLAQLGRVAMNETIVVGIVNDFRCTNEFPRCFKAVTSGHGVFP